MKSIDETILKISCSQSLSIAYILKSLMAAILVIAQGPKSIASVLLVEWHQKSILKSIGKTVLKISRLQGVSIAYILKSSMAAILVFAHGPKSIASVFFVVWYYVSKFKSIGETVLKISRSQVGRTEGRTAQQKDRRKDERPDGRKDGRPPFLCPTQTLFAEDKKKPNSDFLKKKLFLKY